jgi:hypothetical protein
MLFKRHAVMEYDHRNGNLGFQILAAVYEGVESPIL